MVKIVWASPSTIPPNLLMASFTDSKGAAVSICPRSMSHFPILSDSFDIFGEESFILSASYNEINIINQSRMCKKGFAIINGKYNII